ncbi:ATP-binding domain-containing protein [Microtetraspora sp. NBRC 16547]|uniref:HelD family protein n=1 Tax=Microtetraspora sp. NBRC 16547 TaxID=3030993 RepID=UPI002554E576|nr:ATP-binding domain-containing protein [Microtetraspora sp. NBRC 16547]
MVVQGGPGTGKTAVGLHRVTWLLDNEHFTAREVLVVGPHGGFLRYVGQVLPRLGSRGVSTVDVTRLWDGEVRGTDEPPARMIKSDERMAQVLRRAVEGYIRLETLTNGTDEALSVSFRGASLQVAFSEVAAFASEARDAAGPYMVRRRRFVDMLLDRLMHEYATVTRTRMDDKTFRFQLEKQARVATLLNSVWPALNAGRVLRELLGDTKSLRKASTGLFTTEEQLAIARPQARRITDEHWTIDDLVCLEELRHLLSGEEPQRYRHIVVDEAQDLTPMQARSLARRCPSGSMTVLGDLAQATGARQYDVWGRLANILAGSAPWHIAELSTGYRVPTEVMNFAAPLAALISPSTAFPVSVRPPAESALTLVPVDREHFVAETVKRALELAALDREQARSVALVVPDAETGRELSAALPESMEQVSVIPAPLAKGLEFDHVVVLEPRAIAEQGPAGLRRLYVAITRCTQTLTIVHSAPLPVVLGGPEDLAVVEAEPTVSRGTAVTAIMDDMPPSERYDSYQDFLASLREHVSADRRDFPHERLRHSLISDLYGARLQPLSDSPLADITCQTPNGSAVYEVVAKDVSTYAQIRKAAVRLLEIDGAMDERADHLFLVLAEAPQDAWAIDLLDETFNVSVIWKSGTGWEGAHADIALGEVQSVATPHEE